MLDKDKYNHIHIFIYERAISEARLVILICVCLYSLVIYSFGLHKLYGLGTGYVAAHLTQKGLLSKMAEF